MSLSVYLVISACGGEGGFWVDALEHSGRHGLRLHSSGGAADCVREWVVSGPCARLSPGGLIVVVLVYYIKH